MEPATDMLEAARHLCQEASLLLTSLRGGPPNVARGDLAQDLMDLRGLAKRTLDNHPVWGGGERGAGENLAAAASAAFQSSPLRFEPPTNVDPPLPLDVGPFARPFLSVIIDPRAAGPHTLIALRALHRLLEQDSLQPSAAPFTNDPEREMGQPSHAFNVILEPLVKGVLNCKFEQTDAGADEAVEMAIADLLALIVQLDRRALQPDTLMDAFNTVFVTRNTFVHSPALCYHFEDVLTTMCKTVFSDLDNLRDPAGRLILEFLVNQLLHTPFIGGDDDAARDAQQTHDDTRVLCLRLTRTALKIGFEQWSSNEMSEAAVQDTTNQQSSTPEEEDRSLLQIVQDDLCLSLLMTGQAVWAYQDNNQIAPGFISLEVLSEICSTLSVLWTSANLRKHLVLQFEAIFSGFYQRALVLLRKRVNPTNSGAFHSNLYFDAGVEIILESLVDVLSLHDHRQTVAEGNGGSLETLFSLYDCNIKRSDVAVGLMVDLCRCTGSRVDEEGDILDVSLHSGISTPQVPNPVPTPPQSVETDSTPPEGQADNLNANEFVTLDVHRQVPPHLKELCAEAIIGGMKCMFRDDHPTEQTRSERENRESIMAGHVSPAPQSWSDLNRATSSHHMRSIKSKKRLMRRAAQLFNTKSSHGIEFLVSSGVVAEPVTPRAVASFLRNAIVVGLDKKAVGAYLGEVGKSPEAGKSPRVWERDWFHKEALETYCNLFRFERQSLLDGLRMFLASFRLPGEAQQIDRILQAFSDSCSRVCEEGTQGSLCLFSEDPKKASDAAYLLSFSIIMLNTDQHNDNIREDRKMNKEDFVKNNTDYGRDITEEGKTLPKEYLEGIYDSIREEEIRTEGEGADGSMTVERWKDVLRGSVAEEAHVDELPSVHDAEDLTELVLEHVWMPIMSSIGALWGVKWSEAQAAASPNPESVGSSGMLGAQGARLGMDVAWDMLVGVRQLGRNDIFSKIFNCVCQYSGLLDYRSDAADRSWAFANSVEAQSAFLVALKVARDATDEVGVDGWKRIWWMLFELRDLKMLGGGVASRGKSLLMESEPDLLREDSRREWNMNLVKRGRLSDAEEKKNSAVSSMFGAVGRALFGVDDAAEDEAPKRRQPAPVIRTVHGKEDLIIWDELASSDDEDENDESTEDTDGAFSMHADSRLSPGAQFENELIQEDLLLSRQREMPVTGLERAEESEGTVFSPRARVRKRLSKCSDYAGLVSESRLMDDEGIRNLLQALISMVNMGSSVEVAKPASPDESNEFAASVPMFPVSPASEAFAEILIAELALRNRDRLAVLWHNHLKAHYMARVKTISQTYVEDEYDQFAVMTGSMEKCITGMLRITCCATQRGSICNDILEMWTLLNFLEEAESKQSVLNSMERHLGEGLWRIARSIDGSSELDESGWRGLVALIEWCANRGYSLPPVKGGDIGRTVGLAEDDPALQAYRSLHFLLNVSEVKHLVPSSALKCMRTLVATGEVRRCPKLSIAGLDLLHVLCSTVEANAVDFYRDAQSEDEKSLYWKVNWRPTLEIMAEASHASSIPNVRQHALSMLTDSFLEKQGGLIPVQHLCEALGQLCIPLAGRRIIELREAGVNSDSLDGIMIELELCIGLIFKPLRHHVQNVANEGADALPALWVPILDVLKEVLNDPRSENAEQSGSHVSGKVVDSSIELTLEHLRNVIMVLISYGVLKAEPEATDDISAKTWNAVADIECCKGFMDEWKQAAATQ